MRLKFNLRTLFLWACTISVPCCLGGSMDENGYYNFITYYYQSGTPEQAIVALEYFIDSELIKYSGNNGNTSLTSYFFAKIAELNPSIIEDYKNIYRKSFAQGKIFMLEIGEENFCLFVYKDSNIEKFISESHSEKDEPDMGVLERIHIWIEKDTQHIIRVDHVFNQIANEESSPIHARYIQLFSSYNENIVIVPPAFEIMKMRSTD